MKNLDSAQKKETIPRCAQNVRLLMSAPMPSGQRFRVRGKSLFSEYVAECMNHCTKQFLQIDKNPDTLPKGRQSVAAAMSWIF